MDDFPLSFGAPFATLSPPVTLGEFVSFPPVDAEVLGRGPHQADTSHFSLL